MPKIQHILLSILTVIFFTPATFANSGISIIPQVQEDFRSNYTCTIIMKNFEQLYDFKLRVPATTDGLVSAINSIEDSIKSTTEQIQKENDLLLNANAEEKEEINKRIEDLRKTLQSNRIQLQEVLPTLTSTQKFNCATKHLESFIQNPNDTYNCPAEVENPRFTENDILGCSIITGRIRFVYLPRFVVYSLELLTIMSGVLSLLFVILGGYFYLINTVNGSDTEKGKSYIKNALIGLIVSLSAWSVINLVQLFLTS